MDPDPAHQPTPVSRPDRLSWPHWLLLAVLVIGAFAVPLVGPLRTSPARDVIALVILAVGLALAAVVYWASRL